MRSAPQDEGGKPSPLPTVSWRSRGSPALIAFIESGPRRSPPLHVPTSTAPPADRFAKSGANALMKRSSPLGSILPSANKARQGDAKIRNQSNCCTFCLQGTNSFPARYCGLNVLRQMREPQRKEKAMDGARA